MENECKNHAGHEAEIKNNTKNIDDHIKDSNDVRARLFDAIDGVKKEMTEFRNEWSKRLPLYATLLISILMSVCTGLIVAFSTMK